ncbi:DUF3164 family protein [Hydrogenophaga taeniospiralis]|uniref:DUF3164 family protein n=1 Tax=Hydrogenophaga taeniospiralis TaxID=65656 RepID=UPI001CFA6EDC|nr:DUF3164 family protein [Hydrogenophaga taeniospiralis]MCB4362654.1 DUF3164 family protein [Hydrogenophaga taeniospiralis]
MAEKNTIPAGYWQDANGALIPTAKIKDIDKDRHTTVVELAEAAKDMSASLFGFKTNAMITIQDFINRSLQQYDVKTGGDKGNVTLVSFDGRYKITRAVQDSIVFDERLQAAKALIDECIHTWAKGSNSNIKVLVNDAFQVDKAGTVNTGRVLGLRRLAIDDPTWTRAMAAIGDSMRVSSSKTYIRFYERDETGSYQAINLDVAGV